MTALAAFIDSNAAVAAGPNRSGVLADSTTSSSRCGPIRRQFAQGYAECLVVMENAEMAGVAEHDQALEHPVGKSTPARRRYNRIVPAKDRDFIGAVLGCPPGCAERYQ
jgi:hypothetical protein